MTDRIAIVLGVLLILFFGADLVFNAGRVTLFLAQKFFELVDYVEFWR